MASSNQPRAEIADVTFDCSDPDALGSFWAEVLDRPVVGKRGPYVWLERSAGEVGIAFQRVATPTPGKNRIHLDVGYADLSVAVRRIEELGGRRASGYEEGGFLVMLDPEENEFCLVPLTPISLDEEGRTDYLTRIGIEEGPRRGTE